MPGQWSLKRQIVVAFVLAVLAAGVWYAGDSVLAARNDGAAARADGRGTAGRGVPVIVATVTIAADHLRLEAVGTGRANRSVMLRVEAEGRIAEMPLEAGKRFAAGEVLLRIDDTKQRLAVDLATTRLADARRTLARQVQLRGRGAASTASLDEARTAGEIAAIELERAEQALADHVLRAPFDGISGLPTIELGAWVDNTITVASFDDRSSILVEFNLPEALLARVSAAAPVSATTPTAPNRRFEGRVAVIDSRVAADSRSVKVRVAIPNPEDRLRPGASFTVRLDLPGDRFPLVPELALQFGDGGQHVWRVRDGKAEKVAVRLVRRRDGAVLVDGPLAAGDALVVEGMQRLHEGRAVSVLQAGEAGT